MGRRDYQQHRVIIRQLRGRIQGLKKQQYLDLKRLHEKYQEKVRGLQKQLKHNEFALAYWQACAEYLDSATRPKRKRGPKGPRKSVHERRAFVAALHDLQVSAMDICSTLQTHKFPLPSTQLRQGYGEYAWVQWYSRRPQAVRHQLSMDLKRSKSK